MAHQTAADARRERIKAMGEALGSQFDALWQEVVWLHFQWSEYVELFGSKPERVALLNQAAPAFFRLVQDAMWEQTLLHIARLTDPPATKRRKNLTIQSLSGLVDHPGAKAQVKRLVDRALTACEFCRDWRNRRLAHHDLDLTKNKPARPLRPASRKQVHEALGAIRAVLNAVQGRYLDSETFFDVTPNLSGAESLLYVLDDGLRAQARREERFSRGEILEEDYSRDL